MHFIHICELQRKIKVGDLNSMNREKLMEIFQQFCLPHAQRRKKCEKSNCSSEMIDRNKTELKNNENTKKVTTVDKNTSHRIKRLRLSNDDTNKHSIMDTTNCKRKLETNGVSGSIIDIFRPIFNGCHCISGKCGG
jgi:hypothetical protein